ncbi:hypothetical protein [Acidovorax temperans]|uniref:hypothetical protein n=1 Tax=Acidovorax temperans TaxID=80878 RepID=UPI001A944CBD|nr:hypothetical protein [Acidovorax temperans]MBO0940482.1 hypothetical protein [Acidovorax temperans]WCT25556.1 hypothetical protein PQV96_05935 [Acidovorax temperans]
MANGRNKLRRGDAGRDAGGFVALPWAVLDSPAYLSLSMHARALLLEVARQFTRDNNGWLLLSRAHMAGRGWKSCDMLDKSKRELLAAGFIFETVKGRRPNKAARYAVTWRALDRHPGYDVGTVEVFQRGAYRLKEPVQNASLVPPRGHIERPIAPPHGTERASTVPPHGAIRGVFGVPPVPPHGHHLENHLQHSAAKDVQDVEGVQERWANIEQDDDAASSRREAAPRPTRPRRRPKGPGLDDAPHVPQPPDPTAQLELLLNRQD